MPQLNRVRIINFSYNNDSRQILDESFNFHGGENALLSLSNGGGKTVMVQLLMQPVVPCAKIQKRTFASYFKKKKAPSFILSEWKLDDAGGYLLTGMVATSVESQSGEGDQKERLKFFTFTFKYKGSNAFDIANIDFVQKKDGVLQIKSFKEASEMVNERVKKDPFNFKYFPDDDGDLYSKHLSEFGISHEEWKNIICGINDSEGGIEEIFQKSTTSDQLLNEWFIRKTIEKSLFKDKSEARRLEEMMGNLVAEIVENEQFIMEKQLLDRFLAEFEEQGRGVEDFLKSLGEQKDGNDKLLSMYAFVSSRSELLKIRLEENKDKLEQLEKELKRIELEERSFDYISKKLIYDEAITSFKAIEHQLLKQEELLDELKFEKKILEATRLNQQILEANAQLAFIEEKLALSKQQIDKDGRIKELEYSLKSLYQQRIEDLKVKEQANFEKKNKVEKAIEENISSSNKLDGKIKEYGSEKGRLEARKQHFEDYQTKIEKELKIIIQRNMLGEMDDKYGDSIRKKLDDALKKKLDELKICIEEDKKIRLSIKNNEEAKDASHKEEQQEGINLAEYKRIIEEYKKREKEMKEALDRHDINFENRFDAEELKNVFEKTIYDLKKRQQGARIEADSLKEREQALKNGRLHVPEEISGVLEELDIQYETGEAYLRAQEKEIRTKLIYDNPILPYALLMSKNDLEKLNNLPLDTVIRQIVPICVYEDIGSLQRYSPGIARVGEKVSFVCLYEGRMFELESLEKLLEGIAKDKAKAEESYEHYEKAVSIALEDFGITKRFDYKKDHYYKSEKQHKNCEENLEKIIENQKKLAYEKNTLGKDLDELREKTQSVKNALDKSKHDLEKFQDFLEKSLEYQRDFASLLSLHGELDKAVTEFNVRAKEKDEYLDKLNTLKITLPQLNNELRELISKLASVKDAAESSLIEGTIEELEKKLEAIRSQFLGEIGFLENSKKAIIQENGEKTKTLKKMKIDEVLYMSQTFDENIYEGIEQKINDDEPIYKTLIKHKDEETRVLSGADMALKIALDEVRRQGIDEPLSPFEIKNNFKERRIAGGLEKKAISEENGSLYGKVHLFKNMSENIASIIDISQKRDKILEEFIPENDIEDQFGKMKKAYISIEKENRNIAQNLNTRQQNLKTEYSHKNQNIDNIFRGLENLWGNAGLDFDNYFYLFERISQQTETMHNLIRVYESRLENLFRNKEDLVQQSFLHGRRVFEELEKIADGSSIKLEGKARPVQMIKVDMEFDNKESSIARMRMHIDSSVENIKEETRLGKRKDEVQRTIGKLMSSRELLNVLIGTNRIPVSVFKIDLNIHNSRMKAWEDAMRENSGAEKFVVFFSVLAALMTYTRSNSKEMAGLTSDKDTKVLIMDNPFGPISSEHLLKPLFEIAKKYNTQLICLSDLKQTSIMNCFNLIYMLKIRTSVLGKNEYLKFEEHIRDLDEVENDENLEKAVFRASDVKQISLFDIM